jgi:hypothetical protein
MNALRIALALAELAERLRLAELAARLIELIP